MDIISRCATRRPPSVRASLGILLALLSSCISVPAIGADATQLPEPRPERWGFWDQPTLTNDWFGYGHAMRDAGVDVTLEWAQFYQGMPSGDGDHDWEYGGQFSLLTRLDLSKMGLWDGLSVTAQGLFNHGHSVNGIGGSLTPVNSTLYFPGIEGSDRSDLASLYVTQQFNDQLSVSVGKFYTVEFARGTPLRGGGGYDTFWNLNFAAPLSGLTPPEIYGALIRLNTKPISYSLMIYDTQDATNQDLFSDLFENGVTVSGTATLATEISGRPGYYGVKGIYSTMEGTDFSEIIVPPGTPVGTKSGSWLVGAYFQQYLYQDPVEQNRGWGLFGEINLADGNPNVLEWSMNIGIAGSGLFPSRPDDRFGIGYFYTGTSKDLQDELEPVFDLGDESGFEMFYNVAVTPWFRVTADLQVVDPGVGDFGDAVFAGIGTYVKF